MRRFLPILAVIGFIVLVAGCSSGSQTSPSTSSAASTSSVSASAAAKSGVATTSVAGNAGVSTTSPAGHGAAAAGSWDASGNPVNGGPRGADGSTGNNLTRGFCAQHQDPACPVGSYVGPNAIPNPNGQPNYVPCQGTICTNPNHGAGTNPQENGGDTSQCQGTICTNPNHGAGTNPDENGGDNGAVQPSPDDNN